MRVPETDARDDLFDDFEQIILCALTHLSSRQGRGRVGHKEDAEAFLHPCRCECLIDPVGEIDRFFCPLGFDPQEKSHGKQTGEEKVSSC
jgi:hypothetical protein